MWRWLHNLIVGKERDERWSTIVPAGWRVEFVRVNSTRCTIIDEDTTLFDHYCTGHAGNGAVFNSNNMPYRIAECRPYTASKKIQIFLSNW